METRRHTIEDVKNNRFYQFPKFLMDFPLSNDARVLYSLLRDRHDLSKKNNWINKNGKYFLFFPGKKWPKCLVAPSQH